jgi:hypothetical protein
MLSTYLEKIQGPEVLFRLVEIVDFDDILPLIEAIANELSSNAVTVHKDLLMLVVVKVTLKISSLPRFNIVGLLLKFNSALLMFGHVIKLICSGIMMF